jgi:hypothetical protein
MIKRIFQDLDECILHTQVNQKVDQTHVSFILSEDSATYRTIIRPCAKELFSYYNSLVGKENVYILTAATIDYAQTLNRLGEFGVDEDHIFAREHINQGYYGATVAPHPLADENNVLIDNLPWEWNVEKMDFMGINVDNYHKTAEYYGVNFPNDPFMENIQKFIEKRL